jgi:hypothetical protein
MDRSDPAHSHSTARWLLAAAGLVVIARGSAGYCSVGAAGTPENLATVRVAARRRRARGPQRASPVEGGGRSGAVLPQLHPRRRPDTEEE